MHTTSYDVVSALVGPLSTDMEQERIATRSIFSDMKGESYSERRESDVGRSRRRLLTTVLCLVLYTGFLAAEADATALTPVVPVASGGRLLTDDDRPLPAHLTTDKVTAGLIFVGAVSLLDDALYAAVRDSQTPARSAFFAKTTHLGDGLTALAVTAALWPFDPETAELVANASLRAGLTTFGLKLVIARPRPYEDPARCTPYRIGTTCVSMPSGHTATAFSVAHVLAEQYPRHKLLFYPTALLAGWSRVETNNHWPSDVAAGALIGLWAAESVLQQQEKGDAGSHRER